MSKWLGRISIPYCVDEYKFIWDKEDYRKVSCRLKIYKF